MLPEIALSISQQELISYFESAIASTENPRSFTPLF